MFRLSASEWGLLILVAFGLVAARLRFAMRPTQDLITALRARCGAADDTKLQHVDQRRLSQLNWALGAVARLAPFRADCMIQVLAAEPILRRWGHTPEFYLGAGKDDDQKFLAHAWLQCGDVVVTGGAVDGLSVLIGPEDTA